MSKYSWKIFVYLCILKNCFFLGDVFPYNSKQLDKSDIMDLHSDFVTPTCTTNESQKWNNLMFVSQTICCITTHISLLTNKFFWGQYTKAATPAVVAHLNTRAVWFERMGMRCQQVTQYVKAALQLGLFVAFFAFFGLPAVKKFQREETIAVYSSKQTSGIEAPAVTFSVFSNGWKSAHLFNFTTTSQFRISEYC